MKTSVWTRSKKPDPDHPQMDPTGYPGKSHDLTGTTRVGISPVEPDPSIFKTSKKIYFAALLYRKLLFKFMFIFIKTKYFS